MCSKFEVSVVIPTCNRLDWLKRAVSSVCEQTHKPLEIIVVDDCSAQPVRMDQLGDFIGVDVKVINNPESVGGAGARNVGISAARGKYISFLDDDDVWGLNYLAAVREAAELGGQAWYCSKKLVLSSRLDKVFRNIRAIKRVSYQDLLRGNAVGTTSCVTVERSMLMQVGGFSELLPAFQDFDLWLRLARRGMEFEPVEKASVTYTVNVGGKQISGKYSNHIAASELMLSIYQSSFSKRELVMLSSAINYSVAKAIHRKNYLASLPFVLRSIVKFGRPKAAIFFVPYSVLNLLGVYST